MRSRLPSWALLFYLAIDLANPFIPGAFRFTPEEGVIWIEGAPHSRQGLCIAAPGGGETSPALHRNPAGVELRGSPEPVRRGPLEAWLAGVRSGDPPARDFPPTDSEDH